MPLFLKNIAPELDIFGNRQLFNFNKDPSSGESDSALSLINWFTPISNVNANSTFEFLTPTMKGFRFNHSLSTTGTFGNFSFEKYDRFGVATPLWGYNEVTDSFTFFKNVSLSSLSITSDISLNSNKITNLANGIANTDAINLGQLNSSITALGFSGLSTNGFVVRTGTNTYASRSLAGSNGISITNTNGFSGNPTISLSNSYNTSANVTVNWWNLSVSTDVLDYTISPSITYPILLQNITSGNSGTNNLRYWRTISGLGDNTGANAYWSFSYYNQALGVDKVYMSIGIPQNTISLNSKVDVNSNSIVNLNAGISGTDAVNKSQLDAKTVTSTQVTDFNTAVTSVLSNTSIMHGYLFNTQSTNVAAGDHIKFDNSAFTRGTAITLDTSSTYSNAANTASIGRITLVAGKTYKLTAIACTASFSSTSAYLGLKWHNNTTNTPLGTVNTWWGGGFNYTSGGAVVAYITTTVSTRVELRINNVSALTQLYGTSDSNSATWFVVEEV
jgi:hypothetical protein